MGGELAARLAVAPAFGGLRRGSTYLAAQFTVPVGDEPGADGQGDSPKDEQLVADDEGREHH